MENNTLEQYVADQIRSGTRKDAVIEQLTAVGWSEDEALAAYRNGLIASGVPKPTEGTAHVAMRRASTAEIVVNFFSFILLGIVATGLGVLYFQVINHFFPDPLMSRYDYYFQSMASAIHYAIASLVVAYPLYYAAVRLWFRYHRVEEEKQESKLTKWLTYIVLLIASVTIVGDLIAILNRFLQGEITMRFFLKALTIIVIAGMVFGFYYLERKKIQYGKDISRTIFKRFGWVMTALVLIGVVTGFLVAGSPQVSRDRGFDDQRATDLSKLAQCVSNYARAFERLPVTLDILADNSSYGYCANVTDPETRVPYEYRVVAPLVRTSERIYEGTIELCATFSKESHGTRGGMTVAYDKWHEHPAGRDCDQEVIAVQVQTTGAVPVPLNAPAPLPASAAL